MLKTRLQLRLQTTNFLAISGHSKTFFLLHVKLLDPPPFKPLAPPPPSRILVTNH